MIRLFDERNVDFEERIISFIEAKYDLVIRKLQLDTDLSLQNFTRSDEIIDFLCHKLAQGDDDLRIMVPQQIRRDLKSDLSMRNEDELNDLLNDNGLIKIFQGVREELLNVNTKREFLASNIEKIQTFFNEDTIDNLILEYIWTHLQSMRCPHLCPWCGMPCCGLTECNDKYIQGGEPSEEEARNKHSCQFHRDETITGIAGRNNDGQASTTLPNLGDCPNLIRQNQKRLDWNPETRNPVQIPYTYYQTSWRIRSVEDDRDANHGLFWKWFHAHVSTSYYSQ